jgi:hypothetical protein
MHIRLRFYEEKGFLNYIEREERAMKKTILYHPTVFCNIIFRVSSILQNGIALILNGRRRYG